MDSLLESALNAAALRPNKEHQKELVASVILQAMVEWHAENESETLPTVLVAMLYAARRVC